MTNEQDLWLRELFALIEAWRDTRDGTPSKAEAWIRLWKHAHNIGPHWRAREYLAGVSPSCTNPAQPISVTQALEALDEIESAARGDEPFNHFAAPLIRQYIKQSMGQSQSCAETVWCACGDAITQDEATCHNCLASHGISTETLRPEEEHLATARYEYVRKLNPHQFAKLYRRNLNGEGTFDDLVDQDRRGSPYEIDNFGIARLSPVFREFIEGMSVSVDVSTGDHNAERRYFGTVTEVMDDRDGKHGVTLLVQDAEPNWKEKT